MTCPNAPLFVCARVFFFSVSYFRFVFVFHRSALDMRTGALGAEHPSVGLSASNLSGVLRDQGGEGACFHPFFRSMCNANEGVFRRARSWHDTVNNVLVVSNRRWIVSTVFFREAIFWLGRRWLGKRII